MCTEICFSKFEKPCRTHPDFFSGLMPGRNGSVSDYEYGFNGMRKDNEIKGDNNSYDLGARIYDPRIGRWLSCDPLAHIYVDVSPFVFVYNTPIQALDPDGKRVIFPNEIYKEKGQIWLKELKLEDDFRITK